MKNILKNREFTKFLPVYFIILSLVILLGTSYALLKNTDTSTEPYIMNVGLIQVTFADGTPTFNLSNAYPMSDEDGLAQTQEFVFTVQNTGTLKANYDIYIDEISTSPQFKNVIRYAVNKNDDGYGSVLKIDNNHMLYIDKDATLDVAESDNDEAIYKVKFWLDEEADKTYMNKTFTANVVIASRQYAKTVITFNPNGGTVSPPSKEIEIIATTYGDLPIPTRSNYTFNGWYTDATNGQVVTSSTPFTYGTSPTTLYAHWE